MSTVTFQVDDEKAARLADAARERGVAVEELLRQLTDDFLTRNQDFQAAAKYVLNTNAELYRRLAH